MGLPAAVKKRSRLRTVRLRFAPEHDGSGPRPSSLAAPIKVTIKMAIQLKPGSPTSLVRDSDGDETTGQIRIWVTDKELAKGFDQTNPGVPLGLTMLPIAPPEKEDGPPGAMVEYRERRYEIDRDLSITEGAGSKEPGFTRYRASERGGIQP